jgi:hypothetical protein
LPHPISKLSDLRRIYEDSLEDSPGEP